MEIEQIVNVLLLNDILFLEHVARRIDWTEWTDELIDKEKIYSII